MPKSERTQRVVKPAPVQAEGACVCGAVRLQIDVPAVWAWHDHSPASRHAQGCAYATYVGSWRSKFRILDGEEHIIRYEDEAAGTARSFCGRCGTPLTYERARSPKMVNIPRALFESRTGREPRYHLNLGQAADWTYMGEALTALKNYPGVMWERPKRKKRRAARLMEAVFGWRVRWSGPARDGGHTIHVGSDDDYLALYTEPRRGYTQADFPKGRPLNHIGVEVEDLDAVEARVVAQGLRPFGHGDYDPGRRFYFLDPDGIEYEVVSYRPR